MKEKYYVLSFYHGQPDPRPIGGSGPLDSFEEALEYIEKMRPYHKKFDEKLAKDWEERGIQDMRPRFYRICVGEELYR